MFVWMARQLGEIGYFHDIPPRGSEEFGALAVDEQVGSRQAKTIRGIGVARMSSVQLTGREARVLHGSSEL